MRRANLAIKPAALFDAGLYDALFDGCLLPSAGRNPPAVSQIRHRVALIEHLAHLIEKFRVRVVVLPAAGFPELDEIPLPTLNQREPFMCSTVVRTSAPFRHAASQRRRGIGASG